MSKFTHSILVHFGATHDHVTLKLPSGDQTVNLSQFRAKPIGPMKQGDSESDAQFARRRHDAERDSRLSVRQQRDAAAELIVEFWAKQRGQYYARGGAL